MAMYLLLQLELALLAGIVLLLVRAPIRRRTALLLARGSLAVALLAPLIPSAEAPWTPAPQVWAEATPDGGLRLEVSRSRSLPAVEASPRVVHGTLAVGAGGLGLAALWALLCAVGVRRRLHGTLLVRRHGALEVRIGPPGPGSYAVRLPGRAVVVLDEATYADPVDRRMALRHEVQHHRHGDTRFAWLLLTLRTTCAWNPFVHVLAESMRQLEELAVDEALLHRGVPSRDYASCLLRAAERAAPVPRMLAVGLHHPSTLKRRILMLRRPRTNRPLLTPILALFAGALLLGAAQAADSAVTSSPLSTSEIVEGLERARADGVDIPAHPLVAEALQKLTRTPRHQAWMKGSIERQGEWASLVDPALSKANLPAWLGAVPLIESGYRNLGEGVSGHSAAPGTPGKGLWMFIPATARMYGMQVDEAVDDRLNPTRETAAAIALLSDLHTSLGDWGLALAAYNQGEPHVRRAMKQHGTRDLWTLVERGALNDYAPMVYAGALVLHEPEVLD
jgi:membrane-bound lytic murein transglycosylase D